MSLLARDLLDREPLKIHIGLDDIQESELASRPLRAACGKSERALALRRLVDDHEKFPPMAFGENLPLPARARLACAFARLGWGLRGLFRLLLRRRHAVMGEGCPGRESARRSEERRGGESVAVGARR